VYVGVLAFVRSGVIYPNNGTAGYVGNNGYGWSRTARSDTNAYNLNMNPTNVNPSNNNSRFHGFPLRWDTRFGADLRNY